MVSAAGPLVGSVSALPGRRILAAVALYLTITLPLFVVLHRGSRGVELCNDNGFSGPGTLSWWPPGATCVGVFPDVTAHYLSPLFVLAALLALAPSALVARGRRRSTRGGIRTHTPLQAEDFESSASTVPPPGQVKGEGV
jgi:hypothetical protein